MKKLSKFFAITSVFVWLSLSALSAFAGQITGHVSYPGGSDCSGCKVIASIKRGGMTETVYTDRKGNFTLTWSSNNGIAKLFVNGKTVRKNVSNGEHVEIVVD